jgi:hypothetical protein
VQSISFGLLFVIFGLSINSSFLITGGGLALTHTQLIASAINDERNFTASTNDGSIYVFDRNSTGTIVDSCVAHDISYGIPVVLLMTSKT